MAKGTVDSSTRLYTFLHFFPPSPFSEHGSSLLQEHHVVQSGYLNLCIVLEIPILISTPNLVEVFSLQQDSSFTLPDPPAPFIEPPSTTIIDSIVDIHDSVITPALGIPFQDPHIFSFEHQLVLLVSPLIQGFPCSIPLFLPHWSCIGLILTLGAPLFWGGFGVFSMSHGRVGYTFGFERVF